MIRKLLRIGFVSAFLSALIVLPSNSSPAEAACTNPASTYGVVTVNYTVPVSGTFRIWSRIQAPDATNNSYWLQVDGGCPIAVGDGTLAANQLLWVDYQDGTTTSKINMTLTSGAHTFVLTGREPDVMVDRVVLSLNQSCIPTGTGDNCADTATPTPTVTATPTPTPIPSGTPIPTPTPTPTPAPISGDLNKDGRVNGYDLNVILSHWGTSTTGDINGDGAVNGYDLNIVLRGWTG